MRNDNSQKPLQGVEPKSFPVRKKAASRRKSSQAEQQSTAGKKKSRIGFRKKTVRKSSADSLNDEILGIIVDERSGQTFYISLIDNFIYKGKEYAVMYHYRVEDGINSMPEMIIMRSYRDKDKQYFTSIRDKHELNTIFDVFYDRFQQLV
ncbi:MAG TPA: DUF1292 domain-containing protein [Clostridiaceae bacterium]|nr:DUF1292 domain-containing protein [Clostridiaceae bacterium]